MRLLRCSIYIVITLVAVLVFSATAQAGVVTLDVAAKSAVSDTDKVQAKGVKVTEGQAGVHILSLTMEPQNVELRVNGLTEPSYDVYVNGAYLSEKSAAELQNGIQLSIDGTVADPDMLHCLNAALPRLDAEYKRLQKSEGEANRVWHTIRQAQDWARSGIRIEASYRSVSVIVSPAGRMLHQMSYPSRLDAEMTNQGIWRACRNMQDARDRMYDNIKDPEVRNAAVVALTPVSFTADYSIKNGKAHVVARVVNDTNLPISGDITMALPKGWKTTAKSLKFEGLKTGKSFDVAFDLVPPAKSAATPDSVPIAANVTIAQGSFEAKMKLKTNAVKAVNPTP